MSSISFMNLEMAYGSMEEAFPSNVEPGIEPFGSRIFIQMRKAKDRTKGGIILASDSKDTEQNNNQVGKVVAIGPLAFKDRKTGGTWPEGEWCKVGDFVRTPRFGGDKWQVQIPGAGPDDVVLFVAFNEADLIGKVTADPRTIRSYV